MSTSLARLLPTRTLRSLPVSSSKFRSFSVSSRTNMKIIPVPVRSDNYAYLLISDSSDVAVVDPYDVSKVSAALEKEGVKAEDVKFVITTHHHDDHAGGNKEFASKFPGVTVLGGSDKVAGLTKQVNDRETFSVGDINVRCLATPCHTQDSICFFVEDPKTGQQGVFTGDTLFLGGCGRFFEGTPAEMDKALSYLGTLPDSTIAYVGHEYTSDNVAFALSVDPNNSAIAKLKDLAKSQKITTGKTTIGEEKEWNVFMRLGSDAAKAATGESNATDVMGKLREMKNGFRGRL